MKNLILIFSLLIILAISFSQNYVETEDGKIVEVNRLLPELTKDDYVKALSNPGEIVHFGYGKIVGKKITGIFHYKTKKKQDQAIISDGCNVVLIEASPQIIYSKEKVAYLRISIYISIMLALFALFSGDSLARILWKFSAVFSVIPFINYLLAALGNVALSTHFLLLSLLAGLMTMLAMIPSNTSDERRGYWAIKVMYFALSLILFAIIFS